MSSDHPPWAQPAPQHPRRVPSSTSPFVPLLTLLAVIALVVGGLFLRETRGRSLHD